MMEDRIKQDLKQAQLAKDVIKTSVLRLLLSEIHNTQIQKGQVLSDEEVLAVIRRELKKRQEAVASFLKAGRSQAANKEQQEATILEIYLPAQLENEELTKLVEDSIKEVGATSLQDLGKVMGVVMDKVAGRADGGTVSQMVRQKLELASQ